MGYNKPSLPDQDGRIEEERVDRLMPDIDAGLREFLRTQVDSFLKWDLLWFFYQNPNTIDTAENISRYVGRSAENTHKELAELSSRGVLAEHTLNGMRIYSLSQASEVRELLRRFAESYDDRQFRIKAIYQILRTMR
jgi:hypothetical protein